jgi:tetratricopeptide (TPR) repeat protein
MSEMRLRRQVLVFTGFVVLFLSVAWLGLRYSGLSLPTIHLSWSALQQEASPGDQKVATFEPGHVDNLPVAKARAIQDAIGRGDYASANAISSEMLAASHSEVWSVYPFTDFAIAISDLTNSDFESRLTAWVEQDRSKPLPSLIRAQYFYDMAWFRRGHAYTRNVGQDAMKDFGGDLAKAYDDINRVLSTDHNNAYALYLRVLILRGYGLTTAMQDALQEAMAAYPDFVQPADIVLSTLQPKWGGSIEAMYAFVDAVTKKAPADSPLKLLDLDLYRYLLHTAYDECSDDSKTTDALATCVQKNMKQIVTADLEGRAVRSLDLFGHKNDYQTNVAVEYILSEIIDVPGADVYTGPILLAAANGYNSDTRLQEDPAAGHNFMIDKLVGRSWFLKGFNENALTKYQEALLHMNSATFPSEGQKYSAVANIQETLTRIYSGQKQYRDMITSAKAALDAGGSAFDRVQLCFAYYQLKKYDAAIAECTRAIPDPGSSVSARYWRAQSNRELHKDDEAIKDFTIVADSQDSRRAGSVIDMSMIYDNRNDIKGSLDVLNKYPYLYDLSVTDKGDVAIGFNNRCYAYMELGELKKALDDCNASLANGSIPDAYKKQQELIKRLASGK